MIPEIGNFALALALAAAIVQAIIPMIGAARGDAVWMSVSGSAARVQFLLIAASFACLTQAFVVSDFAEADALQDFGRMGQSRGLDAALGADPRRVRSHGRGVRPQPAAVAEGPRARRPGRDRGRIRGVHSVHLEPIRAAPSGAIRGPGSQPVAPGSRTRVPPAVPLSRLCRVLDGVLVRRRRADRGQGRSGLGALGPAVDVGGMVRADGRHRAGQLVGLLRARLGRLVVLGSGRERIVHAVAGGDGATPFGDRGRKTRHAEKLDHLARDPRLRAVSSRHLLGALGSPDLGPRLRHRSRARRIHPRPVDHYYWRRARALRRAGTRAQGRRVIRADLTRGRAGAQQPPTRDGRRGGVPRHALSAVSGCVRRRAHLGRRAVLQRDIRADHDAASDRVRDRWRRSGSRWRHG